MLVAVYFCSVQTASFFRQAVHFQPLFGTCRLTLIAASLPLFAMASSVPVQLPAHVWLHCALYLSWQERLMQASHLCSSLVSPAAVVSEYDHLHLTVPVFNALCSFIPSAVRLLSSAPSVSIDASVGTEVLQDGGGPLHTFFSSLSQLPGYAPPLLAVRSLFAGGEIVQCAIDSQLSLSHLSSLSLHPLTADSQLMHVRNRLWCALHSLPRLRRLKLERYVLCVVDHSVLFSLPLEQLDLRSCCRAQSAVSHMAAVGLSSTLHSLLLETDGERIDRREADALILNLARVPSLRYLSFYATVLPRQLRLVSSIQRLTAVDLSSSAVDPSYLSIFVSPTEAPALPHLIHFSAAQADFVPYQRRNCTAAQHVQPVLHFAHSYSQLRTCKLAVARAVLSHTALVVEALSELSQVRTFALRVAQMDDTVQQQPDSEQDEEEEQRDAEKAEDKQDEEMVAMEKQQVEAAPIISGSFSRRDPPQRLSLSWLVVLELDGVALQDVSLLTVLQGCCRLRRVTCRECGQQTTAAWLLAAINAPHLISLILYAEEVKATAAAWKKAIDAFPSLAYLIAPPTAAQPATTSSSSYPGLAQLEIRMLNAQQSDTAGFSSLVQLMTAAPLTALSIHLPINATLANRLQQLQAMSHIQSLHIAPLPGRVDTAEAGRHQQTADKVQKLLTRCVHGRQLSQQQYAQWIADGWDRELMGDAREDTDSQVSHEAAVDVLRQGDDYTQAGGMFSRLFTTSAGSDQRAGRQQFFHELAGLCEAEHA